MSNFTYSFDISDEYKLSEIIELFYYEPLATHWSGEDFLRNFKHLAAIDTINYHEFQSSLVETRN